MNELLLYLMTVWYGPAYDETSNRGVLTVEAYFKVALEGSRHENRQKLASIGVQVLQDKLRDLNGISASEDKIKVRFERETVVQTPSDSIQVDFREMTYRGKEVSARTLPSQSIPLDEDREYDPDQDLESEDEDDDDTDGDEEDDDEDDDEEDEEWYPQ